VAIAREKNRQSFDNSGAFVLDITFFSTIIYIWYEDGQLRPFLEVDCKSPDADRISLAIDPGRKKR
jgi:hypothetical protein